MEIETTPELVAHVYKKAEENIKKFRKMVNRSLTLSEKILAGHFEDINDASNIESGKSYFRLMGLLKEDFPQLPDFPVVTGKSHEVVKLPQKLLKEMIQLTSFAMSHDETRYVLNGILFSFKDKILKLVATDGRRLAIIERGILEIGNTKKE
ncbi:MAG: hypothetical protein AABY31_00045, partial [Thermoproteota archaeon]